MKEIILKYIQTQLLDETDGIELEENDDLLGSGIIDSMGVMSLINFLENQFDIQIPPQDLIIENFMSVNAITNYLSK